MFNLLRKYNMNFHCCHWQKNILTEKKKEKKGEKRKRKKDEPVDAANKRIKEANINGEFSKKHSSSAGHFRPGNVLTKRLLDP